MSEQQQREADELHQFMHDVQQRYGVRGNVAELLYVADLDETELSCALGMLAVGHDVRYAIRHAHRSVMEEDLKKAVASSEEAQP